MKAACLVLSFVVLEVAKAVDHGHGIQHICEPRLAIDERMAIPNQPFPDSAQLQVVPKDEHG